ncbi:hypothetical protein B0T22DRAFT_513361 [Podospora appendiculata]|uniref:Uncharacterized protein n=1 Tax=Podospora appendiculata TaxID=314037 RepID=A0AAE0XAQ8_9PEZI|nr:hypothetical protein B0T22DRAFT_513361 [Podospora appendiculata]
MASLTHARFQEELGRLVQSHPGEAYLFVARSALMWLAIAERPLRAHELWIALQVEESKDVEHIERLLTESGYVDEAKAVSSLRDMLGSLVSFTPDARNPGHVYVALCDPDLRTFLNYLGDLDVPEQLLTLAFSTSQAHIFAASVCMVICSVSTLHLAHVHDETIASSLALYAWSHWGSHLALSGCSLANANAAGLADSMIYGVCTDVLVLLLSLNDFITGPITLPASEDRTRCAALVKEVQDALERPLFLLAVVVQHEAYSQILQGARQIFEASKHSSGRASTPPAAAETAASSVFVPGFGVSSSKAASTTSKVTTLHIDNLLHSTQSLLGEGERQVVVGFAEAARGVRSLCMALGQPPLYEELLKEHPSWSPLDILINAANWMEAVASYPFWHELPNATSHNPLVISDTADPHYDTALLVLSRLRKDGSRPLSAQASNPSVASQLATTAAKSLPLGMSPSRYYAASTLDKLKALRPGTSSSTTTFTINDLRLLGNQRTSSFATFPFQMQASTSPSALHTALEPFIPTSLRRFYHRTLTPLFSRLIAPTILQPLDDFSSGAFTGGLSSTWPQLKSALLASGYRTALAHFAIAIILHHIRGILVPWLNAYMWYTPMEDLRLALSNPDAFLDGALRFSWTWVLFSYAQKYVCDLLGGLAIGLLIIDDGRVPPGVLETLQQNPGAIPLFERLMEACKIGYIAWILATVEYIFTRAVNTVAFLVAYYKLLAGGDAEHIALGNIVKAHWTKLPLTAWQLFYYVRQGFWPLLWGSVLCAVIGQPGLLIVFLGVIGGVTALIKFRSTFFIALEVSGAFVVLGFLVVTLVLLGVEFADDPLGLKASTAVARKRGLRARAVLPSGANGRTQILSGKTALPVRRPRKTVEVEEVAEGAGEEGAAKGKED